MTFDYADQWLGYSHFFLRVMMEWTVFQRGETILVTYLKQNPVNNATAVEVLETAIPPGTPFMEGWSSMAGSPLIDTLNRWRLSVTGLGLILGAFIRWRVFRGAVLMLFYWAASLHRGLLVGVPVDHGWVVDDHLAYVVRLFGFGALGAGRILGLDATIERKQFVQQNLWLRYPSG